MITDAELLDLLNRADECMRPEDAARLREAVVALTAERGVARKVAADAKQRANTAAANRAAVLPPWTADGPMIAPCAPRCDGCTDCR